MRFSTLRKILFDYLRIPLTVHGMTLLIRAISETHYRDDTGFNLFFILIFLSVILSLTPSLYHITEDIVNFLEKKKIIK